MVVCFVSMCNVSSWGEGKGLVFFLFHWGLSDWCCLRFTALRLCLCAGAAEVILLVCSPGGSLSSRPASGCSHNPLASHPPLSCHESHDSCPGYCCALLIPFILTFIPPQMKNYVWKMQKNPSACLDLNLPFGFLSSSWFHGEPELFTHMFCAVLTHGTAASSVLCSEFLSCFLHKHKDIWPFCIDILCTFTFQALELMASLLCLYFLRVSFVRSSLSCSWNLLNSV